MTNREELIEAGFNVYQANELIPPIYWKTEGKRTMVYYETNGGAVIRRYDGLTKYLTDNIEEWEKASAARKLEKDWSDLVNEPEKKEND